MAAFSFGSFLIGGIIGLFIGGCLGVIVMAILSMAKESDRRNGITEGLSMTLDEAIEHCRAREDCSQCGQEHKQLRMWLEELRERKKSK